MEAASIYETDISIKDLLQLTARCMYFQNSNITAEGINALLRVSNFPIFLITFS